MVKHPFRFGFQAFQADSAKQWRELVVSTEALGYSTFHLADHFLGPGPQLEKTNHPAQVLAAVPAMAMALEASSTLKVGCRVFCMDYRLPVVLAKEAATMDFLSDGRLELGLGAGWIEAEYHAANIRFDSPGTRIRRLEEVVQGVKLLMSGEQVEFEGEFVQLHGFSGLPLPINKPHPPIMIGGGGKKILSLAGREANIVSFNYNNRAGVIGADGMMSSTADETLKKVQWVKDAAGSRFDDIELEIGAYICVVTDHQQQTAETIALNMGLTAQQLLDHPHTLIGSEDYICETLHHRRDAYGISYVTVLGDLNQAKAFAPIVAKLSGT